jgi:uncharacterized membrane protein
MSSSTTSRLSNRPLLNQEILYGRKFGQGSPSPKIVLGASSRSASDRSGFPPQVSKEMIGKQLDTIGEEAKKQPHQEMRNLRLAVLRQTVRTSSSIRSANCEKRRAAASVTLADTCSGRSCSGSLKTARRTSWGGIGQVSVGSRRRRSESWKSYLRGLEAFQHTWT